MRIEETRVYKFEELTDDAKQNAVGQFAGHDELYCWSTENTDTLKAFCEMFCIDSPNFQYGFCNAFIDTVKYNTENDIAELTGVRLLKYLINVFWDDVYKPQFKGSMGHHTKHKRTKNITAKTTKNEYSVYYSAIFYDACCPLTGYGMDYDILQPLLDFMQCPDKHSTIDDIINACLSSWLSACSAEYEYAYSTEAITETIESGDYEFTENGIIF